METADIDIYLLFGNVRDQSYKLTKIARDFKRFLTFEILWMQIHKKL